MYELNIEWRIRKIGSSSYLVGENNAIQLNELGELIVDLIEKGQTEDDILNKLKGLYPNTEERILILDLNEFLHTLREENAIIKETM